jgi:hypothetical protein
MAKKFSDRIDEIMPLVKNGSDLPFAITHENGDWNINYFALNTTAAKEEIAAQSANFLAFLRENDPYAVSHTGADFSNGSFTYVHDKVFCARLRAEYDAEPFVKLNLGEFRALLNAVEDNIGSFPQQTIDYILQFDKPLHALNEMNPIPLYNRSNPDSEPYDAERIDEFVKAIDSKIEEIINLPKDVQREPDADFSEAKANKYPALHVISDMTINDVYIELCENTGIEPTFSVISSRGDELLFSKWTDDYPKAIKAYTELILEHSFEVSLDRDDKAVRLGVEYVKLTDEHCLPDGKNAGFTGKLIIVDAKSLLPEYRSSTSQLVECTHGNGARPDAIGISVFGKELYSGASVVYGRHQILGIADEKWLPDWAKIKLEIQRNPAVFEFCGYHFKPHRKFEKRDGDFFKQSRNIASEFAMGISNYDWGKSDYSHAKFYETANSDADLFMCLETGKVYVPCENELFRYNEPPQKAKAITAPKFDMLAKINNNKEKVKRDKAVTSDVPKKKKKTEQEV